MSERLQNPNRPSRARTALALMASALLTSACAMTRGTGSAVENPAKCIPQETTFTLNRGDSLDIGVDDISFDVFNSIDDGATISVNRSGALVFKRGDKDQTSFELNDVTSIRAEATIGDGETMTGRIIEDQAILDLEARKKGEAIMLTLTKDC